MPEHRWKMVLGGWASGIPAEYIDKKDALDAIDNSEKLLQFCASILAEQDSAERETP